MKDLLKTWIIIAIIFLGVCGILCLTQNNSTTKETKAESYTIPSKTYSLPAKVIYVKKNEVTLADNYGNEWLTVGTPLKLGEVVTLIMDNNSTESMYDDIILDIE